MDRQTTFLLALGMLIAAAFVVGVAGWVLFSRDHALHRTLMSHGHTETASSATDETHREVAEGS